MWFNSRRSGLFRVRASTKAQKYSNARQQLEFSRRKITPTPGKSYRGIASVFLNFDQRGDEWLAWRTGGFIVMENLAVSS
jgi:hypothetical protein